MILGSKQQFIPKYLDGTKIHSIRKGRRWRKGMTIHFYEKVRQKGMRKFRPDGICNCVQDIVLSCYARYVSIDGRKLTESEIDMLAHNDGFNSANDLFAFFSDNFTGQIIHWTNFKYQ